MEEISCCAYHSGSEALKLLVLLLICCVEVSYVLGQEKSVRDPPMALSSSPDFKARFQRIVLSIFFWNHYRIDIFPSVCFAGSMVRPVHQSDSNSQGPCGFFT